MKVSKPAGKLLSLIGAGLMVAAFTLPSQAFEIAATNYGSSVVGFP